MAKVGHVIRALPPFTTPALRLDPREEGRAPKTREFDEVLHISKARKVVGRLLIWWVDLCLQNGYSADHYLCGRGYQTVSAAFSSAAKVAGLSIRVPYELRHGGASEDGGAEMLFQEIQKRGRWKTYSSVTRNNKSGLLQEARASLPQNVLAFLLQCESNPFHYVTIGTAPTLPGS